MNIRLVKLFLRLSIAVAFISAVLDRFGQWPQEVSAWGTWENFVDYTAVLNPWAGSIVVSVLALTATTAEVILALMLLVGFRTSLAAKLSGTLLLLFGLSMALSSGIKAPLDYSVFTASAAAFGLSLLKEQYWEMDSLFASKQ